MDICLIKMFYNNLIWVLIKGMEKKKKKKKEKEKEKEKSSSLQNEILLSQDWSSSKPTELFFWHKALSQ